MKTPNYYRYALASLSTAITLSLIMLGFCLLVVFNFTNNWTSSLYLLPVWVVGSIVTGAMLYLFNKDV